MRRSKRSGNWAHRWRLRRAPALAGARSIWPPPPDISRLRSLYLPHTVLGSDLLVSHAQDEDAPLGGRHALDEEPVRHSPRRSLRLAQECAALGRHPPEHCGPALAVSESLRDCGWDRGDGRERTDSGAAQAAGVIVSGHDPVAVDATCCRIMQIEPSHIEYLTLAGGLEGIAEENIQQIGEKPDFVETRFDLIMELRELRRARA